MVIFRFSIMLYTKQILLFKFLRITTFKLMLLIPFCSYSQRDEQFEFSKNAITIGVNIVDDSFSSKYKPFNIEENWNFKSPIYLGYTRKISKRINIHGMMTLNTYKPGKLVDGVYINDSRKYVALDAMIHYDLSKINENWYPLDGFKPYLILGFGTTSIKSIERIKVNERITVNYGLGLNFWFSSFEDANCNCLNRESIFGNMGVSFQTIGKSSFRQKIFGNQIQHLIGLMYRY